MKRQEVNMKRQLRLALFMRGWLHELAHGGGDASPDNCSAAKGE